MSTWAPETLVGTVVGVWLAWSSVPAWAGQVAPRTGDHDGAARKAAYYPPPEKTGGWRSLVAANQTPTDDQKRRIAQTAGLDWARLLEAWNYSKGFGGPGSLLVIRRGWVAGEWHNVTAPRGIASCTKSLTALSMAKLPDLSAISVPLGAAAQ